jgi:hypothetical protein
MGIAARLQFAHKNSMKRSSNIGHVKQYQNSSRHMPNALVSKVQEGIRHCDFATTIQRISKIEALTSGNCLGFQSPSCD